MKAQAIDGIHVRGVEKLPDGVVVLVTHCNDHGEFVSLPRFVIFDGVAYGKSGWNSDRKLAYYRTDVKRAKPI
jgi:hypothetical protein